MKIIEKIVVAQLDEHLGPIGRDILDAGQGDEENDPFLANNQNGFRRKRGTRNGYIKISQVIQRIQSSNNGGIVIALDFAKAFDTVRFDKLILAMKRAGVQDKAMVWVKSWIYGNNFRVKIGEELSDPKRLHSSVKQGSCLGPMLFVIFINSLIERMLEISPDSKQNTVYDLSLIHI